MEIRGADLELYKATQSYATTYISGIAAALKVDSQLLECVS